MVNTQNKQNAGLPFYEMPAPGLLYIQKDINQQLLLIAVNT